MACNERRFLGMAGELSVRETAGLGESSRSNSGLSGEMGERVGDEGGKGSQDRGLV